LEERDRRWRREADVVSSCWQGGTGLCLFVFEATQALIWKDHEQDHEQDDFALNPHTTCPEIDYILSSLALLCVLFTFPKSIDQMLPLGKVQNSNDVGVITWYSITVRN
jgi:hypothetical protein